MSITVDASRGGNCHCPLPISAIDAVRSRVGSGPPSPRTPLDPPMALRPLIKEGIVSRSKICCFMIYM